MCAATGNASVHGQHWQHYAEQLQAIAASATATNIEDPWLGEDVWLEVDEENAPGARAAGPSTTPQPTSSESQNPWKDTI